MEEGPIDDEEGLAEAYSASNSTAVEGDTMYVAGTKTGRDWLYNLGIPFGRTSSAPRYAEAERTLQAYPKVRRIVGHSLGGAVALELQQKHPELKTRTYSAPIASLSGGERYREAMDPVSILDWGAKTSAPGLNPHSYHRIAKGMH